MHVLSFPFSAPYSGFFVPLEARASFVHNLLHVNTRRLKFCPSLDLSMRAARAHIRVQKGEAALMGEVPHSCLVSTPRCGIPHLVATMCPGSKYSSGPSGCPLDTLHHMCIQAYFATLWACCLSVEQCALPLVCHWIQSLLVWVVKFDPHLPFGHGPARMKAESIPSRHPHHLCEPQYHLPITLLPTT